MDAMKLHFSDVAKSPLPHENGFIDNNGQDAMLPHMSSWPIWIAIVLLLDAGFGTWNAQRLARVIPPRRLFVIAIAEAMLAVALVAWHAFR